MNSNKNYAVVAFAVLAIVIVGLLATTTILADRFDRKSETVATVTTTASTTTASTAAPTTEATESTTKSTTAATTSYDEYAGVYADLDANCWYQFKQDPYLKIYNTVVKSCTKSSYSNSRNVTHYPVCCMCHISSSRSYYDIVKFDSPIEKTYYCSNCGATTYVELKLNEYL